MYSSLPAFYFDERQRVGLFFPENLVGRRFVGGDHSLENECGIMLSSGLDLLDSLTTQKQVVEYSRAFRLLQEGQEQEYCSDLCAPLVLCGDYDRAREILQSILKDTLIERYMNDADNSRVWMPFAFNRIYSAGSDIVLQYEFIQLTPGTQLNGAVYNLTIIALD